MQDGFGGGAEMARNLLFNTCRESSDHGELLTVATGRPFSGFRRSRSDEVPRWSAGAFNSWDRLPYITDIRDGKTPSTIPAWNDMHHNFIVANYAADGGCLDNDDGRCVRATHTVVRKHTRLWLASSFLPVQPSGAYTR